MSNVVTLPTTTIVSEVPNPVTASKAWDTYTLNGVSCPGVIDVDGIHGFTRDSEWDLKKGKGRKGGTLTLSQYPNARGSITSLLWLPTHFSAWNDFVAQLNYYSDKAAITDAAAIYHPALAQNDITQVVVDKIGAIRHRGKKLYMVTVSYIEWTQPPAASAVATPLSGGAVTAPPLPGVVSPDVRAASAAFNQAFLENGAAAAASGLNDLTSHE